MSAASGVTNTVTLRVRTDNSCGWGDWKNIVLSVCSGSSPHAIIVSPNPSTGNVAVSTAADDSPQLIADASLNSASNAPKSSSSQKKIYQIKVLSQTGNVLKQFSYPTGTTSTNINLSSFANGVYILQIYDNVSWKSQQIVILK